MRTARCACAFPMRGDALEAVIVNTAGGMAGGDRFALDIDVGRRRRPDRRTAAAEKVYRSLGARREIDVKLDVAAGRAAGLAAAGDHPVRPRAAVAAGSRSIWRRTPRCLAEAVVFGRAAMGEVMTRGLCVRPLAGAPRRPADLCRRHPARRRHRRKAWRAARSPPAASRIATVLIAPAGEQTSPRCARSTANSPAKSASRPGTASRWRGSSRRDGAALRHDLHRMLGCARRRPLPRLWLSMSSKRRGQYA